jgi:glycerol-3-phosphate O-acyltransferase/dihydroxyacetone phosphate acyltransferase
MVVALVDRPVSFLITEKSMHRPIIGNFARAMKGIPVVRPQDQARTLAPEAKLVGFRKDSNTLVGSEQCQFLESVKKGESFLIKGLGLAPLVIVEVVSNTEVTVKAPVKHEDEPDAGQPGELSIFDPLGFKVIPKVDQGAMFEKTFDALKNGYCVCLFPEGGSSDRTDLLPLKAGVSVMALGADAQGTPVAVVPFGINYNQANAWRSRVLVDVGKPIRIPKYLSEKFQAGEKREAYGEFLGLVEAGLRSVTLNGPDKQTLQILRAMRRMYQGDISLAPKVRSTVRVLIVKP